MQRPPWRGRHCGVLQRVQAIMADLVEADIRALAFKRTPAERALAVQYIAGAFMAVLTWWLDRGAKVGPEEVDAIFRRLVMQGLEGDLTLRANAKSKAPQLRTL